jgi:hypothetical protein
MDDTKDLNHTCLAKQFSILTRLLRLTLSVHYLWFVAYRSYRAEAKPILRFDGENRI